MVNVDATGGRDEGNKGKQVSDFKAKNERREWRDAGRTSGDSCSASFSLHSTSLELNSDLQILPDLKKQQCVCSFFPN